MVPQKNSRLERTSRLRENSVYALNTAEISLNASVATIPQDAQKASLLTRPSTARREAPCPRQGRSEQDEIG